MKRKTGIMALILIPLLIVWLSGCSDDDNGGANPPATGTLTGQVVFHGEWPETGAVQISIFDTWDTSVGNCSWCPDAAAGPPDYYTAALQDPNPNNGEGPDTVRR
jgi:hypothetical protein